MIYFFAATWVAFSEEFVNSQPDMTLLETYEKEIEEMFSQHGIDASSMAQIDFSLYDLNNLMMTTNADGPLVSGIDMGDIEKGFIKLICKMIT